MIFLAIIVEPLVEVGLAAQLLILDDLLELLLREAKQNIFRLQVRVDHSTDSIEKVQAHKYLSCYLLHNIYR
jgi:hypothetical protein